MNRNIRVTVCTALASAVLISCAAVSDNDNQSSHADDQQTMHTVEFWCSEGTFTGNKNVSVKEGDPVSKPENPVKDGTSFEGWYLDNYFYYEPYDFSAPVKSDLRLYAKFADMPTGFDISVWPSVKYSRYEKISLSRGCSYGIQTDPWPAEPGKYRFAVSGNTSKDTTVSDYDDYAPDPGSYGYYDTNYFKLTVGADETASDMTVDIVSCRNNTVKESVKCYVGDAWNGLDTLISALAASQGTYTVRFRKGTVLTNADIAGIAKAVLASPCDVKLDLTGCLLPGNEIPDGKISGGGSFDMMDYQDWKGGSVRNRLAEIILPEGITRIGCNAFRGCTSLTKISIPGSVKEIGACAFAHCSSIGRIDFPESVKKLYNPFYYDYSLTSVTIPDTVEETSPVISFDGCSALTYVYLGKNVKEVDGTVGQCSSLAGITVSSANKHLKSNGGCVYSADGTKLLAICGGAVSTSFSVPDSVTEIGPAVFSYHPDIISVYLDDNLKKIDDGCFKGCKQISSIRLPEGLTDIGINAFAYCFNMSSIFIPASVSFVGCAAFSGWWSEEAVIYIDQDRIPEGWDKKWDEDCNAVIKWRNSGSEPSPEDSSSYTGTYSIEGAKAGATFTLASDSWTFSYLSNSRTGSCLLDGSRITISYSIGGFAASAVFSVTSSGNTLSLSPVSGDYTTIIASAFMIQDSDVLRGNSPVVLIRQ